MKTSSKKSALSALALAGTAALLLAGCTSGTDTPGGETEVPEVDFLACAVSDEANAGWNDKSFNQAAWEGLLRAQSELGVKIQGFESAGPEAFGPNLEAAVAAECDITFAIGFNFDWEGSLDRVSLANPEMNFAWLDGWDRGTGNIKPIAYKMEESSFLAGYVAAAYSKTGIVSTYGGMDIPSVTIFMDGYASGVKYYNEENGTNVQVLGMDAFVGDFANVENAKNISAAQIAAGADVIFPVAGSLFTGTNAAIDESGKDVVLLGVDKDIALTQQDDEPALAARTLTSVEKKMTDAVFDVIKEMLDTGEFSIDAYIGTLENNGTGLSPFYDYDSEIDSAVKAKLEELKAGIIAGTIDPLA